MADEQRRTRQEGEDGYVPPAVEDLDAEDGPAVTAAGLTPPPLPPAAG